MDFSLISRDPEVLAKAGADPLYYRGKVLARTGSQMLKAIDAVMASMNAITIPLIVLQGSADKIVDPSAADLVYHGVSSKDKTAKMLPGLYHEILNEPERADVYDIIHNWILQRL